MGKIVKIFLFEMMSYLLWGFGLSIRDGFHEVNEVFPANDRLAFWSIFFSQVDEFPFSRLISVKSKMLVWFAGFADKVVT